MTADNSTSDFWLAMERFVDVTRNWDLNRRYTACLAERTEGFTERFGANMINNNPATTAMDDAWWREETESACDSIYATEHPHQMIRLVQYRPAWLEQLALRIACIPHVVVNSQYAVTEAVGPLPLLQDYSRDFPAMTGRRLSQRPSGEEWTRGFLTATGNSILDYLESYHALDLDKPLKEEALGERMVQSIAYKALIQHSLAPCLVVVQFKDEDSWSHIGRDRCIEAGGGNPFSFFQARSERIFELSRLSTEYRTSSLTEMILQARTAYQVFEHVLQQQQTDYFMLGTLSPTLVDVLLWDHLMHALADIHLVLVLADFPSLIAFVQRVWDNFFADTKTDAEPWEHWNKEQNEINAFCKIPSLTGAKKRGAQSPQGFQHAVDLMEHLSVRERHLSESVAATKEARSLEVVGTKKRFQPFSTWHRWRMGGQLYPPKDQSRHVAARPGEQDEKIRGDDRTHDEMWIAAVATVTILLVGLAKPRGQK
jgi:hypothetical protein